jgi:hypothetical protein
MYTGSVSRVKFAFQDFLVSPPYIDYIKYPPSTVISACLIAYDWTFEMMARGGCSGREGVYPSFLPVLLFSFLFFIIKTAIPFNARPQPNPLKNQIRSVSIENTCSAKTVYFFNTTVLND